MREGKRPFKTNANWASVASKSALQEVLEEVLHGEGKLHDSKTGSA